jgi:hypothetical protein
MSFDRILYSESPSAQMRGTHRCDSTISELVTKLTRHIVSARKDTVGLYSFCLFDGIGRKTVNAKSVEAIVLDFDNTEVRQAGGIPNGQVAKLGNMVDPPVNPEQLEELLRARNIHSIVTTSYNHKPEWPKFRVIVFVTESIPVHAYQHVVGDFLTASGIAQGQLITGLDPSCVQATRLYYYPSCPAERLGDAYAVYIEGEDYAPDATPFINQPRGTIGGSPTAPSNSRSPQWTQDQIARYFDRAMPHLAPRVREAQERGGSEIRVPCPIHHGDGNNFAFSTGNGLWRCFSQCPSMGIMGGGMYALHYYWRKMNAQPGTPEMPYRDTRVELDAWLGPPIRPDAPQELQSVVHIAAPSSVPSSALVSITTHSAPRSAPSFPSTAVDEDDVTVPSLASLTSSYASASASRHGSPSIRLHSLEDGAAERAERVYDLFGTRINTVKHDLDENGTYLRQLTGSGDRQSIRNVEISPQPIWISRAGKDPNTGLKWYKINYRDGSGTESAVWTKLDDLNRQDFTKLKNLGVASKYRPDISEYFNNAAHAYDEVNDYVPVTEAFGWQPLPGAKTVTDAALVLYNGDADTGACPMTVVAPSILTASQGDRETWVNLLRDMAAEPFHDFCVAWAFLGLSAASPIVSRLQMRNPLLMCAYRTSAGKSTLANLALALWTNPTDSTLPADTTNKGAEDLIVKRPELPVLVEEFQRVARDNPKDVNRFLYAMANGQRRVTSSRDLQHRGGEVRKGSVLFVTEDDLSSQFQQGASVRVLVMTDRPLPEKTGAHWSQRIKAVADRHFGVLGPELEAQYTRNLRMYLIEHQSLVNRVRKEDAPFDGDDVSAIAMMGFGLRLLSRLTGVTLPAEETMQYLIDTVRGTRAVERENTDLRDQIFAELIMSITQSDWLSMDGTTEVAYVPNRGPIAVRGRQLMHPDVSEMEIFLQSALFQDLIRRHQIHNVNKLVDAWLQKGFLAANPARQNTRARWHRKNINGLSKTDFKHEGAYVYLVTPLGMQFADRH